MGHNRPASPTSSSGVLDKYSTKRSFDATPEPDAQRIVDRSGPLLFVVQQHAARKLHFDFRLELDGVLQSWAVPKGLPIAPGEPHLAVPTEDHPLAYGSFEGAIPQGQYGAGTVIVWDCGFYFPDVGGEHLIGDRVAAQQRVREELITGKLSFFLLGEKHKGSYALVRTKDKTWILLKHRDTRPICASGSVEADRSVLSAHTITGVAGLLPIERLAYERLIPGGPSEPLPRTMSPMLAGMAPAPFHDATWLFEPKLDGYRILAHVGRDRVALRSRGGLDLTASFPAIVEDLRQQLVQPLLIDAEVVAFQDGRPSFNALQKRARASKPKDIIAAEGSNPCVLYCFDLLHAMGMNLRESSYSDRRRYLNQCLLTSPRIQVVHAEADGAALYRAAIASGFEGMMAKRRSSLYHPGRRSDDWLKVKQVYTAEFVIGGYSEGKGSRRDRFGALVLGAWNGKQLRPVGNVGSGFDEATLNTLQVRLHAIRARRSPFDSKQKGEGKVTWTRPQLVAEVRFAGWTADGLLRGPVFRRLRDDIESKSVTSERVQTTAALGSAAAVSGKIAALCNQLNGTGASLTLAIDEHRIRLSHLDKILWPAHESFGPITKRELLRYLAAVSPCMLPHLAHRPLTVIRAPDGVRGETFFQKHWDAATLPAYVDAIELASDDGSTHTYITCDNVQTLLWLGQMGALEFHVPHASLREAKETSGRKLAERAVFDRPDYIVFDLDPYIYSGKEHKGEEPEYNPAAFAKAREVAYQLRELLAAMSLRAYVKTSGKTGLHIFVPIEPTITSDQARDMCRLVGQHILRLHPKDITMDWSVVKRTGKIFFDHNMNGRGRTLNAAYSPRLVSSAAVSMPLSWDELAVAEPSDFRLSTAVERLRDNADSWQGILGARHDLIRILDPERSW